MLAQLRNNLSWLWLELSFLSWFG